MGNKAKISIVIPTYNRATTIGKTIDAFISQTYKDWEMIVVDDHSQDNTREVIEEYHKRDSRINYIENERNKGAQGARNTGILHAQSEWVCLFDSDDYAHPDFLNKMIEAIADEVDVVTSYLNLIDVEREETNIVEWGGDGYLEKDLLRGIKYVAFNMAIIRRQKLLDIGLLDEECRAYQEYDTHIRLSRICNYKSIKEVLSDYYLGMPDSISIQKKKNLNGRAYILCKHQRRWRQISYRSFLKSARLLYLDVDNEWRKKILQVAPEILLVIPIAYIKRKILKQI